MERVPNQILVILGLVYFRAWAGKSKIKRGETIGLGSEGLKECVQIERREELTGLGFEIKNNEEGSKG